MAFGENGPRKKTLFEKVTIVVVLLMAFITVGSILLSALSAIM
ncbi:DUF4044 domain-containing protein [Streptococcus pacificus]|uniref:DUF4044 domain-containing protein n=1 Tax=Streptococcus pacificus TaxID=2740577 RepID=A0ABS0ZH66_9STRE|nr:DUF4044 domain-containing protein [Streptococcus pacificus]